MGLRGPKKGTGARIDWELVRREYETGQWSEMALAKRFGVTRQAIGKHRETEGWVKNLASQVRREIEARATLDGLPEGSDKEMLDLAARRGVEVVRQHRGLIQRQIGFVEKIQAKAEAVIADPKFGTTMGDLGDAAGLVSTLAGTLERLIKLERQAFCIDPQQNPDDYGGPTANQRTATVDREIDEIIGRASAGSPDAQVSGEPAPAAHDQI